MSSTPAAIPAQISPLSILELIWCTASIDEPQNLFTTAPATVSGSPAMIPTPLAINIPWGPSGNAHPRIRSSIISGSIVLLRLSNPLIT